MKRSLSPIARKTGGRHHKRALVLLSGGIDSAVCIKYYLLNKYQVQALFVDYGQTYVDQEWKAAKKISRFYKIEISKVAVSGFRFPPGYVSARNALLLNLGLMAFKMKSGIIAIGIHANTQYNDCSEDFQNKIQNVFDVYTNGTVKVDAPLLKWVKNDILEYSRVHKVPVHLAYSTFQINNIK